MTREVYIRELEAAIERAIIAADWEPGDAQRSLRELRDRWRQLEPQKPGKK